LGGSAHGGVRVGVDIGGTFTDIVALRANGEVLTRKLSSTASDYSEGIATGLADLLGADGLPGGSVEELIHGTTVATNAILEQVGAKTGLITTKGFRDVLEIRRLRHPELYNLLYVKPTPLVRRAHRLEVDERIAASGDILVGLDEEDVRAAVRQLLSEGIESIAVCLINAYANPVHEHLIGDIVRELAPNVSCSLSSDVLPEVREYERTSTTVVNAYVRPAVERYLLSLVGRMERLEVTAPVLLMQSNGGILSVRQAMEKPVHIVESGPAAGVVGARLLARTLGIADAVAFDMGGTTAKASLIEEGEIHISSEFEVGTKLSSQGFNLAGGGYAMKVPVIDISEVGAGGGSIISVDKGGSLQIGPRSAGASPGPACYGKGGTEPTVSDANVVLGYLNPEHLAGGAVRLDASLSHAAIERAVAKPLGIGVQEAAWAAHVVASASMMGAIKAVSTQRGHDVRAFTLIAFGGSGPTHAVGMARLLDMKRVIVPPSPGLFSAFGLLFADHEHHTVQTFYRALASLDPAELTAKIAEMQERALADIGAEGYSPDRVRLDWAADLRYAGQGFELSIPLDTRSVGASTLGELASAFHDAHERSYGHRADRNPIQLVNIRLKALGLRPKDETSAGRWWAKEGEARPLPPRKAYFGKAGLLETPVHRRAELRHVARAGPFIIEEYDATVVVPPGCTGRVDDAGNLVIEVGPEP
jgi:N-methylhydantoinase A